MSTLLAKFSDDTYKPKTKSEKLLFDLVKDLTDRRGFRQEWEQIDIDVKEEVLQTWIDIIKRKPI